MKLSENEFKILMDLEIEEYENRLRYKTLEDFHIKELLYNLKLIRSALKSETAIHATFDNLGDSKDQYFNTDVELAKMRANINGPFRGIHTI